MCNHWWRTFNKYQSIFNHVSDHYWLWLTLIKYDDVMFNQSWSLLTIVNMNEPAFHHYKSSIYHYFTIKSMSIIYNVFVPAARVDRLDWRPRLARLAGRSPTQPSTGPQNRHALYHHAQWAEIGVYHHVCVCVYDHVCIYYICIYYVYIYIHMLFICIYIYINIYVYSTYTHRNSHSYMFVIYKRYHRCNLAIRWYLKCTIITMMDYIVNHIM